MSHVHVAEALLGPLVTVAALGPLGLAGCGEDGGDGAGGAMPGGGQGGVAAGGATGGDDVGGAGGATATGGGGAGIAGGGSGGGCPGAGPYDVDHQEPSCLVPYPGSLWTKPLPNDVMSHRAPNSTAIAQCTLTDCGAVAPANYGHSTLSTPGATDWSAFPRYYGNADDPFYLLDDCQADTGLVLRIPSGACLSQSNDHGFYVWDQTSNKTLGLYQWSEELTVCLPPCTGMTEASACPMGLHPGSCGMSAFTAGPAYASGDHLSFGADSLGNAPWSLHVRFQELMDGVILHPLLAVTRCTVGNAFPSPWITYECSLIPVDESTRPATGSLLFLDYSDADIAAMGLPAWQEPLVRAAARYGIYVSDTTNATPSGLGLRFEGAGAYELEGIPAPVFDWLEGLGITPTTVAGAELYALPFLAGLPDVLSHIHVADPCVARELAGLSEGCP